MVYQKTLSDLFMSTFELIQTVSAKLMTSDYTKCTHHVTGIQDHSRVPGQCVCTDPTSYVFLLAYNPQYCLIKCSCICSGTEGRVVANCQYVKLCNSKIKVMPQFTIIFDSCL